MGSVGQAHYMWAVWVSEYVYNLVVSEVHDTEEISVDHSSKATLLKVYQVMRGI